MAATDAVNAGNAVVPRRLRIAVLNRNFDPTGGGAERYSIALVEQLAGRHEIHVFAQTVRHQHPGVTYHRVSMPMARPRWINQLWYAFATWRATRTGFDVVHSHENTWHGHVQTVHVLPILHNLFVGRTGWKRGMRWLKVATSPRLLAYLWLERSRYVPKAGRAIVVTSNSLREVMTATHPYTQPMLQVITPGIAAAPGPAAAAQKLLARRQLGLPSSGLIALFVANDFHKKGLEVLLNARIKLLNSEQVSLQELTLAVVGNAVHAEKFTSQIKRMGLEDRVVFLGQMTDVSPAYQAADLLVHPTLEDTFGMVVLEAMAHGLPVVVSGGRYCGIGELLTPDVNALVLQDPRDAEELAQKIGLVLTDNGLRVRLASAATTFAHGYRWSTLSILQENIYKKITFSLEK